MESEIINVPFNLDEKAALDRRMRQASNIRALIWYHARIENFNGDPRKASAWIKEIAGEDNSSFICHNMRIGEMIESFRDNPGQYQFLLSLAYRKNRELIPLYINGVLPEFLNRYKSLEVLQRLSVDRLSLAVNDMLKRIPKHRNRKQDGMYQPDLFRVLKTIEQKNENKYSKVAEKAVKKGVASDLIRYSGDLLRSVGKIRNAAKVSAEARTEFQSALKAALEWVENLPPVSDEESGEQPPALPAVAEKQPLAVRQPIPQKPVEKLSDKDNNIMRERYEFCRVVWKYKEAGETEKSAVALADRELADGLPLLRSGGRYGQSALNMQNFRLWVNMLGKTADGSPDWSNHLALAPRFKGRRAEAPRGPEEFWRIFFGLYDHRNKLPLPVAYRRAVERFRTDYPESGEALPDENHVRYIASRRVPKGVHILKREGESAWMNKVGYKISRNWDEVRPNECWFGDHRIHDIFLKTYDEKGRAVARRPWITMFTDAKSWYVVGYRIGFEGINSEFIINTFAQAVHEHGEPESLYFDNGGDFQKRGFTTPVQFKPDGPAFCILNSLNIRLRTALPYRGRAKTIERVFRYASDRLDRMFLSYLGNRPGERPENAGMYSKEENAENLPSLDEFCRFFERFLNDYHNRPNNGKILKGLSPAQAYDRQRMTVRAVRSEEEYKLAFLLPDPTLRKVRDGARVEVDHKSYFNPALYDCFGSSVMVKRDLQDRESVYVYTPEGRFLCRASTRPDVPALADSEEERKLLAAAMKLQNAERREADESARRLTGGQLDKFTAAELDAMTPEQRRSLAEGAARLETAGEYRSVQGEHRHKRYRLKGTEISGANVSGRIDPEGEEEESEAERLRRLDLLTAMYE